MAMFGPAKVGAWPLWRLAWLGPCLGLAWGAPVAAAPHTLGHAHGAEALPTAPLWRPAGPPTRLAAQEALAEAHSPAVRAFEAALQASEAKLKPAGAWANPALVAQLQLATDPMNNMTTVGFRQPLDFRGLTALRRQQAEREVEAARLGLARAKLEARSTLRAAFEALAIAEAEAEGAWVLQRFHEGEFRRAQRRVAEGALMAHERVDAELALAGAKASFQAALAARQAAAARLNLLLGRPSEAALGPAEAPQAWLADPGPLAPWLAQARQRRLELAEAQAMVAREALGADLARALRLGEGELDLEAGTTAVSTPTLYAAFAIPVPVWNDRQGEVAVAEAQRTRAEAERALKARVAELEVAEAHGALVAALGALRVLEAAALPQAEHAVERARARLAAGAGTADERAAAEAGWLRVQAEARRLRQAAWGMRRRLDAAVGL